MGRFSISSLDPNLLDLRAWLSGNLDKLDDEELALYDARQRAVGLLVQDESDDVIQAKCGMAATTPHEFQRATAGDDTHPRRDR